MYLYLSVSICISIYLSIHLSIYWARSQAAARAAGAQRRGAPLPGTAATNEISP